MTLERWKRRGERGEVLYRPEAAEGRHGSIPGRWAALLHLIGYADLDKPRRRSARFRSRNRTSTTLFKAVNQYGRLAPVRHRGETPIWICHAHCVGTKN